MRTHSQHEVSLFRRRHSTRACARCTLRIKCVPECTPVMHHLGREQEQMTGLSTMRDSRTAEKVNFLLKKWRPTSNKIGHELELCVCYSIKQAIHNLCLTCKFSVILLLYRRPNTPVDKERFRTNISHREISLTIRAGLKSWDVSWQSLPGRNLRRVQSGAEKAKLFLPEAWIKSQCLKRSHGIYFGWDKLI